MPKRQIQVSKDSGRTWKFRWVDPTVMNPAESILEPGDWLKVAKGVLIVGFKDGMLTTTPFQKEHLPTFKYSIQGQENEIEIKASTQTLADIELIEELIQKGVNQDYLIINELSHEGEPAFAGFLIFNGMVAFRFPETLALGWIMPSLHQLTKPGFPIKDR